MSFLVSKKLSLTDIPCGSNPFDVLKTLAQTNKGASVPLRSLVGQMYQNQGVSGFYRGVEGASIILNFVEVIDLLIKSHKYF